MKKMLLFALFVCSANSVIQSAADAPPSASQDVLVEDLKKDSFYNTIMKNYPFLLDQAVIVRIEPFKKNPYLVYYSPRAVAFALDYQRKRYADFWLNEPQTQTENVSADVYVLSHRHSPNKGLLVIPVTDLYKAESTVRQELCSYQRLFYQHNKRPRTESDVVKTFSRLSRPSERSLKKVLETFKLMPRGSGVKLPAEGSSKKFYEQMKQRAADERDRLAQYPWEVDDDPYEKLLGG